MGGRSETITYSVTSPEISSLCKADKRLSFIITNYGDLSYTLHSGGFPFVVETIVGQMLSNKAADAITTRLYALCNGNLSVSVIERLDQQAIKNIGLSNQKATYIKGLAEILQKQPVFFDELKGMDDNDIIKRMSGIRGLGAWSVKMYLIFVLNRLDVLPFEDGAFLQVYRWLYKTDDVKPSSIIKQCAVWKPYSSLATRYLYRALDSGLVRRDTNLNKKIAVNNNA